MKRILIAPVTAALLAGNAAGFESMTQNGQQSAFGKNTKDEGLKEGFSLKSDVYYTDHKTDHYRKTKYALADGIYALQANNSDLELYLEGKAGTQTESYRLDNGYASSSVDPTIAVYMAAEVGAKYQLLDNVAVGARFVMADNVPDEEAGQNVEMSLKYTF